MFKSLISFLLCIYVACMYVFFCCVISIYYQCMLFNGLFYSLPLDGTHTFVLGTNSPIITGSIYEIQHYIEQIQIICNIMHAVLFCDCSVYVSSMTNGYQCKYQQNILTILFYRCHRVCRPCRHGTRRKSPFESKHFWILALMI